MPVQEEFSGWNSDTIAGQKEREKERERQKSREETQKGSEIGEESPTRKKRAMTVSPELEGGVRPLTRHQH